MNTSRKSRGFVLPLVLTIMVILVILSVGVTMTSYGSRINAVKTKAQTEAMLAAEAGYENAIFWMCQQGDILGALQAGGGTGNIDFGTSNCSYQVRFQDYIGARPVFQISSTGQSGRPVFTRVVDVAAMQETSGWAMGACRVPYDSTTTGQVNFVDGEKINMPLHINDSHDSPDSLDIFITGSPQFMRKVEMGEPRKTSGGTDKYSSVMSLFGDGIVFDQPDVRITNRTDVDSKITRFHDSTALAYRFTPHGDANIPTPTSAGSQLARLDAVQLEFFVQGGVGKVRITNNCTVLGYRRTNDNKTWDFMVDPCIVGTTFTRYFTYAYHYKPPEANQVITVPISDTYVSQHFGGYTSDPGGQIYVNGNVIIGSGDDVNMGDPNMVVKGKITVVATGNIWIGDNIMVDGAHDANGMPAADNPNVLGLIAKGVVKVVDPGMSENGVSVTQGGPSPHYYPYDANSWVKDNTAGFARKHRYRPIGNGTDINSISRTLPDSTVVEAAITVGGGGWGAENVRRDYSGTSYGGRKNFNGNTDYLYVHGSITEVIRGVVGLGDVDGYLKEYTIDNRLMSGILPADIWFGGKYIPAPAGWHDHAVGN